MMLLLPLAIPGAHIDRLFGADPASLTELINGDLFLAWYSGDGESAPASGARR